MTSRQQTRQNDGADNFQWLESLRRDHDTAVLLLKKQGMVICRDPAWMEKLEDIFIRVSLALFDVILGCDLALVYCYDQQQQPPRQSINDGYSSVHQHTTDGRRVSSVGVSIQALQRGPEYAVMVLIHELGHVTEPNAPEHGRQFHECVDRMIERYNKTFGANVTNDYFGLEAGRPISAVDQEAVEHMRENAPPPPSPFAKVPVTVPHHGKMWRDKHRR